MKTISIQEYIKGLPDVPIASPELDKKVLLHYMDLCKKHGLTRITQATMHIIGDKGFGINTDYWGDAMSILAFSQIVHPMLPWTLDYIASLAPDILKLCEDKQISFAPPSLFFMGKYTGEKQITAKLNSRIMRLKSTYEDSVATLNTKRRSKLNSAYKSVCNSGYIIRQANEADIDYAIPLMKDKFLSSGEDNYQFALSQIVWSVACNALCIETTKGRAFYTIRDIGLHTTGVSGDKEALFIAIAQNGDNAGAELFSIAVDYYSKQGIDILEPTHRNFFDESSIDIYKRIVTNEDRDVDMLLIGTESQCTNVYPPYYNGTWVTE